MRKISSFENILRDRAKSTREIVGEKRLFLGGVQHLVLKVKRSRERVWRCLAINSEGKTQEKEMDWELERNQIWRSRKEENGKFELEEVSRFLVRCQEVGAFPALALELMLNNVLEFPIFPCMECFILTYSLVQMFFLAVFCGKSSRRRQWCTERHLLETMA